MGVVSKAEAQHDPYRTPVFFYQFTPPKVEI